MSNLVNFGFGYCAKALSRLMLARHWTVTGTSRSAAGVADIAAATHVLVSIPPGAGLDPVLATYRSQLSQAPHIRWIGYLSTIGVYGDTGGAWVDEDTPPDPRHQRSVHRVGAERQWLAFAAAAGRNVQIYRLAGIYGPGRNPLLNVLDGSARRIVKPGQVFNRIHLADIAQALAAGIERGRSKRIFNVTDDEPAPPDAVVAYAADLLGLPKPPEIPFAQARLAPMAASFYADNRRVRNVRLRHELGVQLLYPSYREGLAALATELRAGGGSAQRGDPRS